MAKKETTSKASGNIYDRIFRENAQHIFIPLIEMQLGFKITYYQALQEKLPKTLEREIDFLYRIKTNDKEEEHLLHIEFQTKDEKEMLERMQEYHGLIFRKYKLPIEHIVIYLGKSISKMRSQLTSSEIFTGFKLISLNEIDAELLLNEDVPEVVLLALLGKSEEKRFELLLRSILDRLLELSDGQISNKYLNQLLLLSRIRKLEQQTLKFIADMPVMYDIQQDTLFLQGIEKGILQGLEKGMLQGIEKGILQGLEKGMIQGLEKGKKEGAAEEKQKAEAQMQQAIIRLYQRGLKAKDIVAVFDIPLERIQEIIQKWISEQKKK